MMSLLPCCGWVGGGERDWWLYQSFIQCPPPNHSVQLKDDGSAFEPPDSPLPNQLGVG